MPKNPFKTQAFKALEAEWNAKLKDNVEDKRGLHSYHDRRFRRVSKVTRWAAEAYYSMARTILISYPFESETQKLIWSLHCDGKGKRQITKILFERGVYRSHRKIKDYRKSYGREQVGNIINKIKETMK